MNEPYDPLRALQVLNEHGVRYVVIGGFAGVILGSSLLTVDLDVCYDRAPDNLDHLASALRELHASLRVAGVDEDRPFKLDARSLAAGDSFTFTTAVGDLDVLGTPSGTKGFTDLAERASTYDLGDGLQVLVVDLEDLLRMKRSAGRKKDEAHILVLEALRDERRKT